ncbi:inositol polyphosphate 1-phosphatase isoform X1 [Polypterus senegalus]|nr:inositol polyphosphate 1-phosphatase isoform X1 [Polypterus senegalus]
MAPRSSGPEAGRMSDVLAALVRASEKAANIARACRQEALLFQLLIEEKKEEDKNKKFVTDFKTLADVLVQEVIKHDVGHQFPVLKGHIFGEESNEFTNGLGQKICVKICETEKETAKLLSLVLDGNEEAASALARAAHQSAGELELDTGHAEIPPSTLGVWVDPIDSTLQYIKGIGDSVAHGGVHSQGLQCVTVLIGAYLLHSGMPVMGVVNQPFAAQDPNTKRWTGQYFWGLSFEDVKLNSLQTTPDPLVDSTHLSAVLSSGEAPSVREQLGSACGGDIHYAAGAGYKCLCVIRGLVDVYVFSEDTTFKWDCCGPHAILCSLGGGMVDLKESLRQRREGTSDQCPELLYNAPVAGAHGVDRWANTGGLVAFRSRAHLERVLCVLSSLPC